MAAVVLTAAALLGGIVGGGCSSKPTEFEGSPSDTTTTSGPLRSEEFILHPDCLRADLRRVCSDLQSASRQPRPAGVELVGDAVIDRTTDGRFRLTGTLRRDCCDVADAQDWVAVNFRVPEWEAVDISSPGRLVYRLVDPNRLPIEARMDLRPESSGSKAVLIDLVLTTEPYPVAGDEAPAFTDDGKPVTADDLDQVGDRRGTSTTSTTRR